MDLLAHHVRIHLTGAAAGIELFGRGRQLWDAEARATVADIRRELVAERRALVRIVEDLGSSDPVIVSTAVRVGERLGRLKPNGDLLRRTPLTDVVDLEAMRDAVAGKIAGWEAMRHSLRLDRQLVEGLLDQARRQHDQLSELHDRASRRAFGGRSSSPNSASHDTHE